MKKYQKLNRFELNQTTQQRLDELRIFQYLLRHNDRMHFTATKLVKLQMDFSHGLMRSRSY